MKRAVSIILILFLFAAMLAGLYPAGAVSFQGSGTMQDPYLIQTAGQLQDMREILSAHYKLVNTIDASGMDFKPIGRLDKPFTGSFVCELNQDNTPKFVIKNLKIAVVETAYAVENQNKWEAALFGATRNATISGIYLMNVNLSNQNFGDNKGAVIYNNYKPGMDEQNTAALIGQAMSTTVSNCASSGVINSRSNHCGGLIGRADGCMIENCYSTVTVTSQGRWNIGGFVGSAKGSKFQFCFSTGNVQGGQTNISAFAGGTTGDASFSDCYATGDVSGGRQALSSFTVWLAAADMPDMKNCYATGKIDAETGEVFPGEKSFENCWSLTGTASAIKGFAVGDKAAIIKAFQGKPGWDTSGDLPVLQNIGVVTDLSQYVPGTSEQKGPSGQNGATSEASALSSGTAQAKVLPQEVISLLEALPEEDNITLNDKESIVKAYQAYQGLSEGEKEDIDSLLAAKLFKARTRLSHLLVGDVVTRIKKLPIPEELTDKDKEEILSIWNDYEILTDEVKAELDEDIKQKIKAAYEFATSGREDGGKVVTMPTAFGGWDRFIVIFCAVIIALTAAFNIAAAIWLIRRFGHNHIKEVTHESR